MSVNLLRSVSVIAISTSLAMPAPIMAQSQTEAPAAEACPDGSDPVTDAAGQAVCRPQAEAGAEAETDSGAAQAEDEAAATAAPETDAVDSAPTEQAESDTATPPPEQTAAEAEGETATEAESAAEVERAPEAGGEVEAEAAPVEDEVTPESEGTAATEAPDSATAGAEKAPEVGNVADAEGSAVPNAPATEAETEAAGQAMTQTEEQPADQATTEAEGAAAETEAPATGAEGAAAVAPETAVTDEEVPSDADTTTDAASDATAETQAAEGAPDAGDAVDVEVSQDDTAETTAEANQTAAAEAAAEENVSMDTVETDNVVTVTEESARSSNEEFGTATAAPTDRDEGMSKFEKFALGALGVAAAATYLNNRNDEVVVSSQDRLVVRGEDGNYRVLKNDDELLRRPGVQVATKEYSDGSTRSVVTREDGVRVVTIRAPDGQVLKRTRIMPDGREIVLFDDTVDVEPVQMSFLEQYRPEERTRDVTGEDELRAALMAAENPTDRRYSLQQIRQIRAVRELVPEIDVDDVNFESGSAVIRAEEAQDLSTIGNAIAAAIEENPDEVFMIEGHTDAVGGAPMNLALSDRRAESAALALTEYFDIPPENLVVQGYGKSNLKVRTNEAERANRRVAVRRITPLLYSQR